MQVEKGSIWTEASYRAWYGRIDSFLKILGFTKSKVDPNIYMNSMDDELAIQLLYVDDLFLTGNEKKITDCKKKIVEEFEIKDLGFMHYFLGLEVWHQPEGIFMKQGKYVVLILKIFDMLDCKSMATPIYTNLKLLSDESSELVDMTQYKPIRGQCLFKPIRGHLISTKHVMRYLKGTIVRNSPVFLSSQLKQSR